MGARRSVYIRGLILVLCKSGDQIMHFSFLLPPSTRSTRLAGLRFRSSFPKLRRAAAKQVELIDC
jgi:hypothetical protein